MATADQKKHLVEIIREMIENNEEVLNSDMAEEASRRLGKPVTKEEISRVRSEHEFRNAPFSRPQSRKTHGGSAAPAV